MKPSLLATYHDLFHRMSNPVLLLNHLFEVIEVNEASERMLGVSANELTSRVFASWFASDVALLIEKKLRISARKYYPFHFEADWNHPSGQILNLKMSGCNLKLSDGTEVLQLVAENVTQEKEYLKRLEAANRQLAEQSTTDELTQLANTRSLKAKLQEEHERARRFKQSYSVVFFDIDHFKNYNDTNGHPAGDQLLRQMGAILKSSIRPTDSVARYGGEEFVIVCANTKAEEALFLAERLRKKVESYPFAHASKQPLGFVSISLGIADSQDGSCTPDVVVAAADQAAYESKRGGRNRTTLYKNGALKKTA